ncbi:MAG: DUF3754 domain-containing protein [Planctomycetales bacterium]|nr:DUF3754 domain-containing protein [Planctomycetales bacterium]
MRHLDEDTIVDQTVGRRENFVPLHTTDVVEYLAQHPSLASSDRSRFRELAAMILSHLHHLYRQRHEHLTYIYAPLDPDRDRMLLTVPTPEHRDRLAEDLYRQLPEVLARANYHRLSQTEIEQAIKAASRWGVRMRINFAGLDHIEVYGRGSVIGQRTIRTWKNFLRAEPILVPLYQRVVVVFRTNAKLKSTQFDSRRVYLRMFKNVPQQDVDMLLPSIGIQMTWLDHSRIVVPSLYAAGITLWRFLRNVLLLTLFGVFKTAAMVVLGLFAIGFGIKSMLTYRTHTKRRHMLNMAQSLYYQNLDNNLGVLLKLLEEGEQQEACEAILAYFAATFLLGPSIAETRRDEEPSDSSDCCTGTAAVGSTTHPTISLADIDHACEALLLEATQLNVDFDVESTVRNLSQLGIMTSTGHNWQTVPLTQALQRLDKTWDDWFR